MNISDAIKIADPNTTTGEILQIGEKYKMSPSGTVLEARKIAVRLMRYAIDGEPRMEFYQGGERRAFCPNCDCDITEGSDSWEYCP